MSELNSAGLGSLRELLQSLRRLGWLIAIGGVVGVVAATLLTSSTTRASATARIGLTKQVQWPFYDAARQRVAGINDSLKKEEVLTPETGVDAAKVISVEVTMPTDQTFLNVRATATDPATATKAANVYASKLVALDSASPVGTNSTTQASLNDVQVQMTDLQNQLTTLDANNKALLEKASSTSAALDVLRSRPGTSQAQLAEATLARDTAQAALDSANNQRDLISRRLSNLQVTRDTLNLQLKNSSLSPEVQIIRSAVAEDIPGSPLRTRQILGLLTGAVVTGLLAWVLDRSFGIIRTPVALRSATELPVIDARWERGAGRLAIWMERLSESHTIGFIGGSEWLEAFLYQLQPFLLESATVATPAQAVREVERPGRDRRMLVALGEPTDGHWFDRGVGICDEIVLLVLTGQKRPAELQQLIGDVSALGSHVSLVVLLEPWTEPGRADSRVGASTAEAA